MSRSSSKQEKSDVKGIGCNCKECIYILQVLKILFSVSRLDIMLTRSGLNLMIPLGKVLKSLVYKSHFLLPVGGTITMNHFWNMYVIVPVT